MTLLTPQLETFINPEPHRDYLVTIETAEFTCLCPKTGQPDFAFIKVDYIPDVKCVELKSFKLYLWGFRDQGTFHEAVTNLIMNDFVKACDPRFIRVTARFNVRGGINTTITVQHLQQGRSLPSSLPL